MYVKFSLCFLIMRKKIIITSLMASKWLHKKSTSTFQRFCWQGEFIILLSWNYIKLATSNISGPRHHRDKLEPPLERSWSPLKAGHWLKKTGRQDRGVKSGISRQKRDSNHLWYYLKIYCKGQYYRLFSLWDRATLVGSEIYYENLLYSEAYRTIVFFGNHCCTEILSPSN